MTRFVAEKAKLGQDQLQPAVAEQDNARPHPGQRDGGRTERAPVEAVPATRAIQTTGYRSRTFPINSVPLSDPEHVARHPALTDWAHQYTTRRSFSGSREARQPVRRPSACTPLRRLIGHSLAAAAVGVAAGCQRQAKIDPLTATEF
jgi:hypothetical protein